MFGKLLEVIDNKVVLENKTGEVDTNYINLHVIFNDNLRKIVGEIISLSSDLITIKLIGEIIDDKFISGLVKKPNLNNGCRIVYKSEVELLVGKQDLDNKDNFYIGKSLSYDGFNVTGNLNDFFSNHFAIVGNTGSGKSCSVVRILQNIFYKSSSYMPRGAHLAIFDVYGEYNNAFKALNNINRMGFKSYSTKVDLSEGELINIPAYFLSVDDLALLLNVTSPNQLPLIEKTLKLVYIFKNTDETITKHKDDIIASTLLDVLTSGRTSTQIRDQVIAILTRYNTDTLNLDTEISQPGYTRTIKQCLNIDNQGKMNSLQFVVDLLEKYKKLDLGEIKSDINFVYSLEDIYYAMEFALINEGVLKSDKMYDEYNQLKVRLQQIINSDYKEYFKVGEYISKGEFIKRLFKSDRDYQIINFNLNHIDERFAKKITKIYSKLFFDFSTTLESRGSFPIHIILEEAHRYVQRDTDIEVLGYNIFDRITKEGRKYGVILGMITQRPSELSITALSQCSNFIILRMFYPDDLNMIKSITTNIEESTFEKIKSFLPGNALVFGVSFKIPLLVSLDLPNPMPESTSVNISDVWYK
ncbi:MAG: DUF87 domain-containing protein [Bacilli bacterium]|nr:DUF87 domain-containing protein [Bacilli bacterium]